MTARNTYVKTATGWEQIATTIAAIPQGLVPIVPDSVTNGSFTGDGAITVSAKASVIVNGVFTAAYDNYLVQFVGSATTQPMLLRLASNGVVSTTDAWGYGSSYLTTAATAFYVGGNAVTNGWVGNITSAANSGVTKFDIYSPFLASPKLIFGDAVSTSAAAGDGRNVYWNRNTTATSRDGFQLYLATGTFTGTIRVYGYSRGGLTQPSTLQPYSQAAGSVTMTGNGTGAQAATITFPAGRFTAAPIVSATSGISSLFAAAYNVTATSATVSLRHFDNTAWSTTQTVYWQATQMTSASGTG